MASLTSSKNSSEKRNQLRLISKAISSLPVSKEIQTNLFDIVVDVTNGKKEFEVAMDEISRLTFVMNDSSDQSSHDTLVNECQHNLGEVLDGLWLVIDEENASHLHTMTGSIRTLFNRLFDIIREQTKVMSKLNEDIQRLTNDISSLKISESELLLGSLATQLVVKFCHYLKMQESVHTSKFRTCGMINNHTNIEDLKNFLHENGYQWDQVQVTIKMLKQQRLSTAHPSKETTTTADIEAAICQVYPNSNSSGHVKARIALRVLQLLAGALDECLFISTEE